MENKNTVKINEESFVVNKNSLQTAQKGTLVHKMLELIDSAKKTPFADYVYIAWDCTSTDYMSTRCKVGRSKNPIDRMQTIKTQAGIDRFVPYMIFKSKHDEAESNVHNLLREYRGVGEWFNIPVHLAVHEILETDGFFEENFNEAIPVELITGKPLPFYDYNV